MAEIQGWPTLINSAVVLTVIVGLATLVAPIITSSTRHARTPVATATRAPTGARSHRDVAESGVRSTARGQEVLSSKQRPTALGKAVVSSGVMSSAGSGQPPSGHGAMGVSGARESAAEGHDGDGHDAAAAPDEVTQEDLSEMLGECGMLHPHIITHACM